MSAVFPTSGNVRQLDRSSQPDDQVTEEQVQDPKQLARLVQDHRKAVAALKRRWQPIFVEHEDVSVDGTGTTKYRFPHKLGKRVRWWPVDWADATAGPRLVKDDDTDEDTLVLVSYTAGTLTLRIEEAG
jgi:hypothetical protein